MVVETKRSYLIFVSLFMSIALAFVTILWSTMWRTIIPGLFLIVFDVIFIYVMILTHGRTLIFSETGCTVRFRTDEVHILWDDIVVKRVEPGYFNNRNYSDGGVFFSLRPAKKSPRSDPAGYALFHPNTCFWVYFKPVMHWAGSDSLGIYEVEKDAFLNQLNEWGVELEHIPY